MPNLPRLPDGFANFGGWRMAEGEETEGLAPSARVARRNGNGNPQAADAIRQKDEIAELDLSGAMAWRESDRVLGPLSAVNRITRAYKPNPNQDVALDAK